MDKNPYGCPDCGEDPPSNDGFYYVDSGDVIDCTGYLEDRLEARPPAGKKAYPRYSDFTFNMATAINFGGNPQDWEEVHMCSQCEKEYSFSNGNY